MKKLPAYSLIILSLLIVPAIKAQMTSVVNSNADDEFAHVYDFQSTPNFDESTDGICEDSLHRCTLRAALEEASILGLAARVTFSITSAIAINDNSGAFGVPDDSWIQGHNQNMSIVGSGPNTITLLGIGNNTLISGIQLVNAVIGITVGGNGNRIGLDDPGSAVYISEMSQNGIILAGDNNQVSGNVIGLDILGNPVPNLYGIFVTGRHNIIGGTNPGEGNIISGNDIGIGVYTIDDSTYIVGNKIGVGFNGAQSRPNRVGIDNIGPNTIIGTNALLGRNIISGNTESGVLMGIDAENCFILNNYFGTDSSGTVSIPNRDAITLGPGSKVTTVANNFIKNNTSNGILLSGISFSGLATEDNLITGNTIEQNGNVGIAFVGEALDNVIGSSLQTTYPPNQIKNNGMGGVVFIPGTGTPQRNTIRENSFQDNTNVGIRIITGQGGIQPPTLTSYTDDGQGTALIVGTHALTGAIIDLYAGDLNQTGHSEGIQWLGSGPVDGNGDFSILISSCTCDSIVATATDAIGNTSQFSSGWGPITALDEPDSDQTSVMVSPNPFKSEIRIRFDLKIGGDSRLTITDAFGRKIETIVDEHLQAGEYEYTWRADQLPAGIYFYQLLHENKISESGKLILME